MKKQVQEDSDVLFVSTAKDRQVMQKCRNNWPRYRSLKFQLPEDYPKVYLLKPSWQYHV